MAACKASNEDLSVYVEDLSDDIDLPDLESLDTDPVIQLELDEAIKKVQLGTYQCESCNLICRSKGGLTRHKNSSHKEELAEKQHLTRDQLIAVLNLCSVSLSTDECYPMKVRQEFRDPDFSLLSSGVSDVITEIYTEYIKHNNPEKYYEKYFQCVPLNAQQFFPMFSKQASMLLVMKLAEMLIIDAKKEKKGSGEGKKALTNKDIECLQYLGGYVVMKLYKKAKNSKNWNTKETLQTTALLLAGKAENCHHQGLIECLSRGGLWAISKEAQEIFRRAEVKFREYVCGGTLPVTCIKYEDIVCSLMEDHNIVSIFNSWALNTSIPVTDEVQIQTMENILGLYIRVRAFSYARDITENEKRASHSKKRKGLRKEIRNSGTDKK